MTYKIHTLDTLQPLLRQDGDCTIWTGGCSHGHGPVVKRTPIIRSNGQVMSARRLLAQLQRHPDALRELSGKLPVGIWRASCGNPLCVGLDHMQRISKSEQLDRMRTLSNTGTAMVIKRAKITETRRRKDGKLPPEAYDDIQTSSDGSIKMARKYGVNPKTIRKLRQRALTRTVGTVWSGLGARPQRSAGAA